MSEQNLKDGFFEFLDGGLDEEIKQRYKLAVTAYFKAITQICDLIVLRKRGYCPSSHTDRFRILETHFPKIYLSVDSIFMTYQDTYSIPISKGSCEIVKNEIKKIIRDGGLAEEFKESLSRL
ncbi:MAG TPA: hypothetical protein VFF28_07490 [Candidatus Nanoarchaeia archaeon]|nr:hypothetical protein [Candidatus Nanoarchaeia archaeon]